MRKYKVVIECSMPYHLIFGNARKYVEAENEKDAFEKMISIASQYNGNVPKENWMLVSCDDITDEYIGDLIKKLGF